MYNIANGPIGGDVFSKLTEEDKLEFKKKAKQKSFFSNCGKEKQQELHQKAVETRKKNNIEKRKLYNGYTYSEETRKRMSKAQRNRPPITEETRKKLSFANKGKKLSLEHKEAISKGNLGKHLSIESRQKLSKSLKEHYKTHENPFKGKQHTEETKKIISEAVKQKTSNWEIWVTKDKIEQRISKEDLQKYLDDGYIRGRCFNTENVGGHKQSLETRDKISKAHKGSKHNRILTETEKLKMVSGVKKRLTGTIRLSKDDIYCYVKPEQVESYLQKGYKLPKAAIKISNKEKELWVTKRIIVPYLLEGYFILEPINLSSKKNMIAIEKDDKVMYIDSRNLLEYLNNGYKIKRI